MITPPVAIDRGLLLPNKRTLLLIYLNQYIIMIMKVCERVRKYENSKTEFTLTVTEKSLKDIAAFVNTSGGTIYYGVDDSGKVVGLNDIDDQFTRLTNMIRDSISPDITLFMNAEIIEKIMLS